MGLLEANLKEILISMEKFRFMTDYKKTEYLGGIFLCSC